MKLVRPFLLLGLLLAGEVAAQSADSIRTIGLQEVEVRGQKKWLNAVPQGMYEQFNPDNDFEQIAGFASLVILDGAAGDDLWSDSKKGCMRLTLQADSSYRIWWDKPGGGCNWVGMGIGWDQWSGKNLLALLDSAAIELKVRLPAGKPAKTLPLAFGFEDYSNRQAWLGMSARWVVDGPIGAQYAHIRLPLQQFNWEEQGADPTNIKQFIIQFEAAGEIDLRHIRLVRHTGINRKQAKAQLGSPRSFIPWQQLGSDSIRLSWDQKALYVEAILLAADGLQNTQEGSAIWNGDAIELAFAAQPELSSRPRARFLFSDLHIGISLGADVRAFEFRTQKTLKINRHIEPLGQSRYRLEATLNWTDLEREPWSLPGRYLLEIARDQGDASGRKVQYRWNSGEEEGFHTTPSLWGELLIPDLKSQK